MPIHTLHKKTTSFPYVLAYVVLSGETLEKADLHNSNENGFSSVCVSMSSFILSTGVNADPETLKEIVLLQCVFTCIF